MGRNSGHLRLYQRAGSDLTVLSRMSLHGAVRLPDRTGRVVQTKRIGRPRTHGCYDVGGARTLDCEVEADGYGAPSDLARQMTESERGVLATWSRPS